MHTMVAMRVVTANVCDSGTGYDETSTLNII